MNPNDDVPICTMKLHLDIPLFHNVTKEIFQTDIYPKRVPAILRGVDIGPCGDLWTLPYLSTHGGDNPVKIHVSETPQMDFIHKNFIYRSLPFSTFIQRAAENEHSEFFLSKDERYYLRALGSDPRKDVADIRQQFPELAADITLPTFYEPLQFYSSVFRIASPHIQLWTHYDVMDNMLIQVTGRKRVVLFSPREVENLYLNGDKSEVVDIDNPDLQKYPKFANAERHECFLEPGDILFIPALWFHNVISLEFGVAVNVFWKHLADDLYDPKDTYGNKDPRPATRATQIVDRALKTLSELPEEYKDFYARMLVSRIQSKAYMKQKDEVT